MVEAELAPDVAASELVKAVDVAVSTRYGLSSSIYTNDLQKAIRFMRETDTGVVHVSKPPVGAEALGPKELDSAVDFFTQTKTVYLDHS